jgi:predicted ribosome quality control (RQC) complex YloA/Tae2 family protein
VHNNYYLLRKLTEELIPLLVNSVLSECYSQNKDELVLRVEVGTTSRYIKANLQPAFSCVSFPEVHPRARKNSVDLFADCIGLRVESIRSFENERSFSLVLSNGFQLLFKMHANRANIILYHNNTVHALFRNNLQSDENLSLASLNKQIDWREEAMPTSPVHLKQHYFIFGKLIWDNLTQEGFFDADRSTQWNTILKLKSQLEHPTFYVAEKHGLPVLSLIPMRGILKQCTSAMEALHSFCQLYLQQLAFRTEQSKAVQHLQQIISASLHYLDKTKNKLTEVSNDHHYKQWADLLMANLHSVKPRAEKITLIDFYTQQPVELKLKQELSAQKNAEVFYRKAKNQQIEIDRLTKAIAEKERELVRVTEWKEKITKATSLKELREHVQHHLPKRELKEKSAPLPYHEFVYNGYHIWVGRNAQANDVLTLKFAHKEDLWLHAKDVAGSHVVVKQQAGKSFPKEVIERAAELAAYNSKRKTESLAPVAYTLKKFVRKRKGDLAGTVVVEREEVILVEPKLKPNN